MKNFSNFAPFSCWCPNFFCTLLNAFLNCVQSKLVLNVQNDALILSTTFLIWEIYTYADLFIFFTFSGIQFYPGYRTHTNLNWNCVIPYALSFEDRTTAQNAGHVAQKIKTYYLGKDPKITFRNRNKWMKVHS